jgi:hypothetical protein
MYENSKSAPSVTGLQYPGAAPCGCHTPTKRRTGLAAVWRNGVAAGTIDSSSGRATIAPAPRRNVRRGMCFFVINIANLPGSYSVEAVLIWNGALRTTPSTMEENR